MAKQNNSDEESLLKRNARHRLIGAVALATFVVVTLPLIFDSQPPPTFNSDIEIKVPGEAVVPPTNLIAEPTTNAPVSVDTTDAATSVAVKQPSAVADPAKNVVTQQPSSTTKEESSKTTQKETSLAAPENKAKVDIEKSKAEADKNVADADKTKAENKAKEISKVVVPAHGAFALQLGAYANPASAKNMEAKLEKLGFHAYSEKIGSNVRVRIGGFSSREAAEKARKKLSAQELRADVIRLN